MIVENQGILKTLFAVRYSPFAQCDEVPACNFQKRGANELLANSQQQPIANGEKPTAANRRHTRASSVENGEWRIANGPLHGTILAQATAANDRESLLPARRQTPAASSHLQNGTILAQARAANRLRTRASSVEDGEWQIAANGKRRTANGPLKGTIIAEPQSSHVNLRSILPVPLSATAEAFGEGGSSVFDRRSSAKAILPFCRSAVLPIPNSNE